MSGEKFILRLNLLSPLLREAETRDFLFSNLMVILL